MDRYARISVNVPAVMGCFDYSIPEALIGQINPGCLVEVPFGKQMVQGIVLSLLDKPEVEGTRKIDRLLDPLPVLTHSQIHFAEIISETYLCTLSQAVDLMVPSGLSQQADILITIIDQKKAESLSLLESQVFELVIKKKSIRGRQMDAAFPRMDWKKVIRKLQNSGVVEVHSMLPKPTLRPHLIKTVQLCADQKDILDYQQDQSNKRKSGAAERRTRVLEFLQQDPEPVPVPWVYAQTACNMSDLQVLEAADLVLLSETEWIRDPVAKIQAMEEVIPTLTQDQSIALLEVTGILEGISQSNKFKPSLLHGVTGSGKTEIYLRTAEKVIALGRKVIILVPEISLTPQTVRRFINRFPGRVGLFHSRLTPGERYDTWRRVRAGRLDVIIGPRSALFIPFKDIGLIVVDECHDDSYSQSDHGIFFDSRILAQHYANLINAACIFGSATPDVSQKFEAEENGWHVLSLPNRIKVKSRAIFKTHGEEPMEPSGVLPPVQIVDMREELKSGNTSILSLDLKESLKTTLEAGQQAILYLNRRGKATYIFCRNCGKALVCPRCDFTLTAHGENNDLFCHQCGYKRGMPSSCPGCNSKAIRQLGVGTESVEAAVRKLLPSANILRWDAETSRYKDAHEIILSHFVNHRADILIGTQMISKGLDFPLVTLVGVILAETGLSLPDYRASERTFQLLAQVSGRAGRSDLGGKVIFQTYQPDHYVIGYAASHDYDGFYSRELDYRRKLGYPPFYQLVRLEISSQSPVQAEKLACSIGQKCAEWIQKAGIQALEQIGPVPCYYGKVNNIYRWQVILRGMDPVSLIKDHRRELTGIKIEVNPPNLL